MIARHSFGGPRRLADMLGRTLLLIVLSALLAMPGVADAHKEKRIGPLRMQTGWVQEPAYAGVPNAVEVSLRKGGAPVEDARLTVQLAFGEADVVAQSDPLSLDPVAGEPGEYRAFVIPTRPGTYTFAISGRAAGTKIDEEITSGPQTFDDVVPASDAQFPEADPSQGEVAERLERIDARLAGLRAQLANPGQDGGDGGDAVPYVIALSALAVALVALVVALARRRGRGAA